MTILAILLLFFYGALFFYVIDAVSKGKFQAVLLFSVIFFPIYALFLAITYDAVESIPLARVIQYSKEVIIFGAFGIWVFGQKGIINRHWKISLLDRFFIAFIVLAIFFFILGVGDATVVNRAIYVKNILLIGIFYFFGRNIDISFKEWDRMFQIIFVTTLLACCLVVIEKFVGTHFHTIAGYAKYNFDIKGEEPTGIYGLAWTFAAEGGRPRYGSFFAHPLELSSSMLIAGSASLIYLISVPFKNNKYKYLGVLVCSIICVLFAYSRASFVAFFLMLVFMAFLLKYYQILGTAFLGVILVSIYILFFAADEVLFFVLDTISFQNSSSMTHVVDWLNAIESIIANPMGIGLAMSGNAGGVEKDLIVGGENQFLVYGVQMGVLGALLYIGMLFFGIRNSWRAFRLSPSRKEGIVPFIAASVKFGLLLPLFTANAEVYLYVCLVSWWFIGYAETKYQVAKQTVFEYRIKRRLSEPV